jgi:hypothetical protein
MAKALCNRCKASAEGSTFEEASSKINHAAGLGRGIPCGATYGCVVDVSPKPTTPPKPTPQPKKITKSKDKPPKETGVKKEEVKTETDSKKEESQAVSE